MQFNECYEGLISSLPQFSPHLKVFVFPYTTNILEKFPLGRCVDLQTLLPLSFGHWEKPSGKFQDKGIINLWIPSTFCFFLCFSIHSFLSSKPMQCTFILHTHFIPARELLGSQALWPMLMASCGLPALVQLVTLPFFPESPPYLLMHKGDQEGCKKGNRGLQVPLPHLTFNCFVLFTLPIWKKRTKFVLAHVYDNSVNIY